MKRLCRLLKSFEKSASYLFKSAVKFFKTRDRMGSQREGKGAHTIFLRSIEKNITFLIISAAVLDLRCNGLLLNWPDWRQPFARPKGPGLFPEPSGRKWLSPVRFPLAPPGATAEGLVFLWHVGHRGSKTATKHATIRRARNYWSTTGWNKSQALPLIFRLHDYHLGNSPSLRFCLLFCLLLLLLHFFLLFSC